MHSTFVVDVATVVLSGGGGGGGGGGMTLFYIIHLKKAKTNTSK